MNVLFVSSGNSNDFEIAPFIKKQGESLKNEGINIDYFTIKDKGVLGYLKATFRLRKLIEKNQVDIVHAHYTLSGWTSVLCFSGKPIVLSLMGSDAYGEYIGPNKIKFSSRYLIFLTYLIQPFTKHIICKSRHIQRFVYLKGKSSVIPNGVDLSKECEQGNDFRNELDLEKNKQYVLFLGSKNNIRKNYKAVEKAMTIIGDKDIELLTPYPISHDKVIKYLKSVDVLVVPSFMEGSPNVVKEAMLCNCPVVATDVGDIQWLFGNEEGHYLTNLDVQDVAKNIKKAINFSLTHGRTSGCQRIIQLGLGSKNIAERIAAVYKRIS